MKSIKNKSPSSSQSKVKPSKKLKAKNLSPAKKFRLRLRRAKFQKQQQAKDDYFEHDTRESARAGAAAEKKKAGRLYKKGRRAQMYIDAYLKSQQHVKLMNQNGDTASQDETQDSSNGVEVALKSIVHKAALGLPPMSSHFSHAFGKEQAVLNGRALSSTSSSFPTTNTSSHAGNLSTVKCCCHCACPSRKKNVRRKLSSPYFGDFNRTMSFANGSCAREAAGLTTKILNKTTTTTLVNAAAGISGLVGYNKLSLNASAVKMKHPQMVPVFNDSFKLQGRSDCDMRAMRSVIRLVMIL